MALSSMLLMSSAVTPSAPGAFLFWSLCLFVFTSSADMGVITPAVWLWLRPRSSQLKELRKCFVMSIMLGIFDDSLRFLNSFLMASTVCALSFALLICSDSSRRASTAISAFLRLIWLNSCCISFFHVLMLCGLVDWNIFSLNSFCHLERLSKTVSTVFGFLFFCYPVS